MKILAIIPAKLDSKRLPKKNIQIINGKTLIEHSIDYAKHSKYNPRIIISSESDIVKEICNQHGVRFHKRPTELCGDIEVVDVYEFIINELDEEYDIIVGLQPDNPNRSNTLDDCLQYMIENNYDDLITVNNDYKRSGSIRIFKYEFLKNGFVSKRMGCIRDSAIDIHFIEDLNRLKS